MNTEEKAKRYDEALEVCKKLYNEAKANEYTSDMEDYESIFPELVESEDEKIRRTLIRICKKALPDIFKTYGYEGDKENIIAWLEKQGEQKSANKVEPKFHEGEWIIGDKDNIVHQVKTAIENVSNGKYAYDLTDGGYISTSHESDYHLWTIKNAKDGDVLASELCYSIILFKGIEDNNIQFYCDYDFSEIDVPGDRFAINNGQHYGNVEDSKDFQPATKEQRNILMKAMAEAGYTFDFEKKELKKIERKSTWIEEDEKLTDVNHEYFSELLENNNSKNINDYAYQVAYCMSHDWAIENPTWDDVQKACKLGAEWNGKRHKSTWSEEDEKMIIKICQKLYNYPRIDSPFDDESFIEAKKEVDWLNSLKDRVQPQNQWKPTEEQMRALDVARCNDRFNKNLLNVLYNDLKKLTEE